MHGEIVHAVTRFNRVFSLLCVLALLPNSPDASQLSLETAAFFPFINSRLFLLYDT
jgi:hypothetical protein